MGVEEEKRRAGELAAALVEDGMRVGLGTGTTVAYVVTALGERAPDATYVATSPATAALAERCGLDVVAFEGIDSPGALDLAIDGADEVAPDHWLVKGRGGAHTREKVVAAAAERFVVVVDTSKLVDALHPPVPLELLSFGLSSTIRLLGDVTIREAPRTPDGNVLADYRGDVGDPRALQVRLHQVPGVVSHGLFPPELVDKVLVGRDEDPSPRDLGGAR